MRPWLRATRRLCAAAGAVCGIGAIAFVLVPPSAHTLAPPATPGITLTDRGGAILRSARATDGSRLRWVPLSEMEPAVIAAFVAMEDRGFYAHHGIEWRSLARALRDNVWAGQVVSGASTITMQAARLVADLPRGWRGKPMQLLWALRLEHALSKQAILEQYLNRVPLGQGAVGVESASQLYFGASASNLSLGQAALLAGLAHAPSRDNPLVDPARARARRNRVLARFSRAHYASAAELERAALEPVRVSPGAQAGAPAAFAAPHFTSWLLTHRTVSRATTIVQSSVQSSATTDASVAATVAATVPATSGTTLRTTLDLGLQQEVEGEVRHAVQHLADQQVQQAAAVVLDNVTGDVLAWVGSPDFEGASGQVDMVVSRRQPGSALKPFVYALGFDRGVTAATVLDDMARSWPTPSGPYAPRNYDRREHGPVRAREALASSYNIPAVQLADRLGIPAVLRTLRTAGFASLSATAEHYGLGLALGDGDVTLLELANAYRALGNGGVWRPVRTDADAPAPDSARRFVSEGAATLVLDVLADPVARLGGFGASTPFDFAFPAAVKTGTSRHFTDNWATAVTGAFTVAVWVGNFDGHPMAAVSGVTGAGPLLRRIVLRTAGRYAPGVLRTPDRVHATRVRVCRLSGMLATQACPAIDEWFLPGTAPTRPDDWYREGALVLPSRYAAWRARTRASLGDGANVSTNNAREAAGVVRSAFALDSPRDGDRYQLPVGPEADVATISLRAMGANAVAPYTWWVDGHLYRGTRWKLTRGQHEFAVLAPNGQRASARIVVE